MHGWESSISAAPQLLRLLSLSLSGCVSPEKLSLSSEFTHRKSLTRNSLLLKTLRNSNLSKPSPSHFNGNLQQLQHWQMQLDQRYKSGGQARSHGVSTIADV